jgi:hypothetical protein
MELGRAWRGLVEAERKILPAASTVLSEDARRSFSSTPTQLHFSRGAASLPRPLFERRHLSIGPGTKAGGWHCR